MSEENEALVRKAYEAYGRGDVTRLLELVHPDLEWTYLDPSLANPQPQVGQDRAWQGNDRNYLMLTLRQGQVATMRAFRDLDEARIFASEGGPR